MVTAVTVTVVTAKTAIAQFETAQAARCKLARCAPVDLTWLLPAAGQRHLNDCLCTITKPSPTAFPLDPTRAPVKTSAWPQLS